MIFVLQTLIGGKVRRRFGDEWFIGDVTFDDGWYVITYDDGDREDLSKAQVKRYWWTGEVPVTRVTRSTKATPAAPTQACYRNCSYIIHGYIFIY